MSQPSYPEVVLAPEREQPLLAGHPWVYSKAVRQIRGQPAEGDVVRVLAADGRPLAWAHFYPGGIQLKILSRGAAPPDLDHWRERARQAAALRSLVGLPSEDTDGYRLINAEGDGCPGLVVDRYAEVLVMQCQTLGMWRARQEIAAALRELLPGVSVCALQTGSDAVEWFGELKEAARFSEAGIRYQIEPGKGQKTGFFLDQRENRALVCAAARGAAVLNLFSYSGGFSLSAARGGASEVVSVDASAYAGELAERHWQQNQLSTPHQMRVEDCFAFLEGERRTFPLIVCDPPAFAKHIKVLQGALGGYQRLNLLALQRLSPGGLFFTFSCSQAVSLDDFRGAVMRAAARARRSVQVVRELRAAPCHPTLLAHPEGSYLKGLMLRVE